MTNCIKILCLLCLLLAACQTTPKNPEAWMERETNACLPTAIAFREGLKKYGVWAEVLTYRFVSDNDGKQHGHAIVSYLYPPGKNRLFTYDSWGSYPTRAYTNDAIGIAKTAHYNRGFYNDRVYYAEFLK